MATSGSSHPRTGDQRSVDGSPDIPCGSNTVTGRPPTARACMVTTRLSARVDVVTTAPGASRMALMITYRPLPERGAPWMTMDSSVET